MKPPHSHDTGKRNSSSPRKDASSERRPNERLAHRAGRRSGNRPPVDPDLERFLISHTAPGTPTADPADAPTQAPEDDGIEVIIPEVIESHELPRWKRLDETEERQQVRQERAPAAPVAELVHVPEPDPLFPDPFPAPDRRASDTELAVRVMFRRFPMFILVAVLIWSVFAMYLAFVPAKYESEATLLVDISAFERELDDLPRLSAAGGSFGGGKLANQVLILQSSPELAQRVATELSSIKSDSPGIAQWTIFDAMTDQAKRGGSLATLLTKDYVQVNGGSADDDEPDAISISVVSTDPSEAALIANIYSQTYVSEVDQLVGERFEQAMDFYQGRRDLKQGEVDELTEGLKQFIRDGGSVIGESETDHLLDQIATLNTTLDDASIEIEELKASIASLENEVDLMDGQLVAERAAHGIEDQLDASYERIAELNIEIEKFYIKNPELRDDPSPSKDLTDFVNERTVLLSQVDSLSRMYSSEITAVGGVDLRSYDGGISYMASLRRDLIRNRVLLDAAEAKQQAAIIRLADYENRRRTMPERALEYRELSNRHTNALNQLEDVERKIHRIEEAADGRQASVRILKPAIEPTSPKVHPMMIAILGGILGLLGGIGAAFMSEKTDRRVYERDEVEDFDVEVMASIPRFKGASRNARRPFYDRKITADVITLLHPEAPASRPLRSIPLRMAGNTLRNSVFVFTSVDPKAGTTFMAVNTAAAMARTGARVLLVDANIAHPSVIDMLGLSDQARFDMSVNSFADGRGIEAFSGRLPNLYAMALEAPNGQNPEYLLGAHLASFIARVRKQFDAVIVDSAPLTRSTTALGLSRMADEMIVTVRAGRTDSKALDEVLEDVRSAAGSRARVVLNETGKMKVPQPIVKTPIA